jgi:hypothetical protein
VYVESDIVDSIHGVLLIEIAESAAANSRFQKCNLEENPFSLVINPSCIAYTFKQTDLTLSETLVDEASVKVATPSTKLLRCAADHQSP